MRKVAPRRGVFPGAPFGDCTEELEARLLFSGVPRHVAPLHPPIAVKPVAASHSGHHAASHHAAAPARKAKHVVPAPLPSATVYPGLYPGDITPLNGLVPQGGGDPATAPFTPAELRHFYGVDNIAFNGVTGDGTGQTIAIIDAYDQPNLLNSTDPNFDNSDLHNFDVMFGLPDPPSFQKVNEYGGSDTPTTHDSAWSFEESLDVEWAHAIAPAANIVLIECATADEYDLYTAAVNTAKSIPGVVAVSMSFTEPESSGQTAYDGNFTSSATDPGITYFASAGDNGAANTGYPSFSPNVVSVGGTTITTSDSSGSYGSEVVWNSGNGYATGGGASSVEAQPPYQSNITLGGGMRATPDVSFDGDPQTGVYIYDTAEDPNRQLYAYGGTSVGAPCWAGLIAIADQGRSLAGLNPLDGFSQALPRLYHLSAADFHDIVSGNNDGNSAGPGYDMASGLGTPVANILVPDLAGADTITGQVFEDTDGNGVFDSTAVPLAGQTVYLDLNNSGVQNSNDPTAITNSDGIYTFSDEIGGLEGTVRLASTPTGYTQIPTATTFTTSYNTSQTANIALFPSTYNSSASSQNFTVALDATGQYEQIRMNGTVLSSIPIAIAPALTFSFATNGQTLTIDGTGGNPVPAAGISVLGSAGGDTLNVIGTSAGGDSFAVTANSICFGSNPIHFSNVSNPILTTGGGADALNVSSGSLTIAAQTSGAGILDLQFSSITVAAGASVIFATAPLHSDRTLVQTTSLSVFGQLDLGGNDMIIHNGELAAITALLAGGYANGQWNGTGIASAAAANDTTHLTALGVASNNLGNGATLYGGVGENLFDGQAPAVGDILIKYTWYGDANLDGVIDGTDYSRIDNTQLVPATGWFNGDFNFDQHVDGSDYTLMDNAFNQQAGGL